MANQIKITILLFIIGVSTTFAQSINFFKTYGGNGYDYGNGIVQLPDSSYAVTGSSSSFSEAPSQAFILRVDSLGNYIWSLNYGGSKSDVGRRIFYSPTQGYWIAGYSNSFNTPANFDFYLIKTDTAGTMQWQKTYGTSDLEQMWDAVMLPDSGLVMVGSSVGDSSMNEDIYMVRTNFYGDTVWTKHLRTPKSDIAYTCFLMDDTTVIVGGKSSNTIDSLTGYLASFDIDGTLNWQNFYGPQGEATVMDLDTVNNQIFAVGSIIQNDSIYKDTWKLKVDNQGNFLNQLIEGKSKNDYITHIINKSAGALYYSFVSDSPDLSVFEGGNDLFVLNTDAYFNWGGLSIPFSGLGPDECGQMIRTSDGGLMMVGFASDFHFTNGGGDITLIKIGANNESPLAVDDGHQLVKILENLYNSTVISIYPNPTSNVVNIDFNDDYASKYQIYNAFGKLINKGKLTNTIDLSTYKNGLYFIQITNEITTKTFRLIKQ